MTVLKLWPILNKLLSALLSFDIPTYKVLIQVHVVPEEHRQKKIGVGRYSIYRV